MMGAAAPLLVAALFDAPVEDGEEPPPLCDVDVDDDEDPLLVAVSPEDERVAVEDSETSATNEVALAVPEAVPAAAVVVLVGL